MTAPPRQRYFKQVSLRQSSQASFGRLESPSQAVVSRLRLTSKLASSSSNSLSTALLLRRKAPDGRPRDGKQPTSIHKKYPGLVDFGLSVEQQAEEVAEETADRLDDRSLLHSYLQTLDSSLVGLSVGSKQAAGSKEANRQAHDYYETYRRRQLTASVQKMQRYTRLFDSDKPADVTRQPLEARQRSQLPHRLPTAKERSRMVDLDEANRFKIKRCRNQGSVYGMPVARWGIVVGNNRKL